MKLSLIVLLFTFIQLYYIMPYSWCKLVKYRSKYSIITKCNYCRRKTSTILQRDSKDETLFASVAWRSPLEDHSMKIICPMQDEHLLSRDLSSIILPEWLTNHQDPVGRCPVNYRKISDPQIAWPPVLLAAECACERSRCTIRGTHLCITVYMAINIHTKREGIKQEIISVDCICASPRARLVKLKKPPIVN